MEVDWFWKADLKQSYGNADHQHLGEAVDIIPTLDMKFDLVLLMHKKTILIILIFFQNEQRRDYPFW
jgi:hypothetical protein